MAQTLRLSLGEEQAALWPGTSVAAGIL